MGYQSLLKATGGQHITTDEINKNRQTDKHNNNKKGGGEGGKTADAGRDEDPRKF